MTGASGGRACYIATELLNEPFHVIYSYYGMMLEFCIEKFVFGRNTAKVIFGIWNQ